MNGKRAKALRRLARQIQAPKDDERGAPYQAYYVAKRRGSIIITNPNHDQFGETIAVDFPRIELHPSCEKKATKLLKRNLKGQTLEHPLLKRK